MARPNRFEVDYFPHFANQNKEIKYLRRKYGNQGYAVFYLLLEKLALSSHHYINLQDETEIDYLASELLIDEHELIDIIQKLVRLNFLDSELWENYNVLFSQSFNDTIKDAYKRRTNDITSRSDLIELLGRNGVHKLQLNGVFADINLVNDIKKPQSKEEYSKLEKKKEDDEVKKEEKIPIAILFKKYYANDKWINYIIKNGAYRLKNKGEVLSRMQEFHSALLCHGISEKTEDDFLKHFNSWLKKVKMTPIPKIKTKSSENNQIKNNNQID